MTTTSMTLARGARNGKAEVTATPAARELAPAVDIYENGDELLLLADMPGAAAETISVTLEGSQLTITADRGELPGVERVRYQRAFRVPDGVDPDGISAELKDGVLHVRLKKAPAAKPRTIPIHN